MKRIRPALDRVQQLFLRWRRLFILFILLCITGVEVVEHPDFLTDYSSYFYKEIALYMALIFFIVIMLELVIKANQIKIQTINILKTRHNLSLQLAAAKDWDEVVTRILQYPSSILPVSAASLLVYDEIKDSFITERSWIRKNEDLSIANLAIPREKCCTDDIRLISSNIHLVNGETLVAKSVTHRVSYHIAINYAESPIGVLYIVLPDQKYLDDEHIQLLENTGHDLAIGLNAGKQRQLQHAAELANAASNERLEIARDLHDTLGQNLGYLHFKLDQTLATSSGNLCRMSSSDLESLRELANESYELVRSTLVILQHKSDHRIIELFTAHTQIMAKRTGIPISIDEEGFSRSLPPYYLKQLIFAFKESLHNIEKHSDAKQAKVSLAWTDTQLKVRIWDNGCGFEMNQPYDNGHYGLRIIDDRIRSLGGNVEIVSSRGGGTEVLFWLPLEIPQQQPANEQVGEL